MRTGCHGFCERGPLVVVQPEGILYTQVKPKYVAEICEVTIAGGEVVKRLLYKDPADKKRVERYRDVPFYAHQTRIAMRLSLAKRYSATRLEAACRYALPTEIRSYKGLHHILEAQLDRLPPAEPTPEVPPTDHANLRGPTYYQ